MATLDSQVQNHKEAALIMVEELGIPVTPEVLLLLDEGLIQVDRLAEKYAAKLYGTEVESVAGRDLEDGNEVKFACVGDYSGEYWVPRSKNNPERVLRYRPATYASITAEGTKNKTGDIIAVVYDPSDKTLRVLHLRRGVDYVPGKQIRISKGVDGKFTERWTKRTVLATSKGVKGFTQSLLAV
jgi:hypothetical protein